MFPTPPNSAPFKVPKRGVAFGKKARPFSPRTLGMPLSGVRPGVSARAPRQMVAPPGTRDLAADLAGWWPGFCLAYPEVLAFVQGKLFAWFVVLCGYLFQVGLEGNQKESQHLALHPDDSSDAANSSHFRTLSKPPLFAGPLLPQTVSWACVGYSYFSKHASSTPT